MKMTTPVEPKRVPLGKALDLTEADLDALAEVTPADIIEIKRQVERDATPTGRGLWNAERTTEGTDERDIDGGTTSQLS